MVSDEDYSFTVKKKEDLEDIEIGDRLQYTIPTDESLTLSKEVDGDLIPYRWIIISKDGAHKSFSNDRYFYIVGKIDKTSCKAPSGYIKMPAKCNTNFGDLELSWEKGSDNLRYYIDVKVDGITSKWYNKVLNLGSSTHLKFNESYYDKIGELLEAETGIYGTYHYRVRYVNPYNKDCEGLLPEGQFSYVVPPTDLKLVIYGHNRLNTITKQFNENNRANINDIGSITAYYWTDSNTNNYDFQVKLGHLSLDGLEYYLEITNNNDGNVWNAYSLPNTINSFGSIELPSVIENGWYKCVEYFEIGNDILTDGWISWKVKARAYGDKSCECEYKSGLVDFNGVSNHDFCYSEIIPVGITEPDFKGLVYMTDLNGILTVHHMNKDSFQHRLILSNDKQFFNASNEFIDKSKITKVCDWNDMNSNTIDFVDTCGDIAEDEPVYFIIETRKNENSCSGAYGYYIWPSTNSLPAMYKNNSNYYVCDLDEGQCWHE